MARALKPIFAILIVAGTGVLGLSVWALNALNGYQSLSPGERAIIDRKAQAAADSARREQLKGTDCEKLDALACYDQRRQRRNLERAARAYEKSDLKKAFDDAGVR